MIPHSIYLIGDSMTLLLNDNKNNLGDDCFSSLRFLYVKMSKAWNWKIGKVYEVEV